MTATTLDPAEIAKFSALAAEWWNPKGPFGGLHRLNPVRLQVIRDAVREKLGQGGAKPLTGLRILDVGCGGGLVSAPLARMGGDVTAIDASEEAIGAAKAYAAQAGLNINYRCATAEDIAATGAGFDVVTALEILEHVADTGVFLGAAEKLVRQDGLLIVSTINRTPKARAMAITAAEKILKWAPEGAHSHEKLVVPEEIRSGARAITWEDPIGISYNPLATGWTVSQDTDVNYMMVGRRS